jgi:hypothetical protein
LYESNKDILSSDEKSVSDDDYAQFAYISDSDNLPSQFPCTGVNKT